MIQYGVMPNKLGQNERATQLQLRMASKTPDTTVVARPKRQQWLLARHRLHAHGHRPRWRFLLIRSYGEMLTAPAGALAPSAAAGGKADILLHVLIALTAVIVTGHILGKLFAYVGQPPVIGGGRRADLSLASV